MKKILFCFFAFLLAAQISNAQKTFFQTGHKNDINEVKWSPDDKKILSHSSGDDSLRLWDAQTGRLIWTADIDVIKMNKQLSTLTTFDWSPDRRMIASGSYNGTIQIWDAETGKPVNVIDAHPEDVTHVKFTPDGKRLISSANTFGLPSEIKIWNVADGKLIKKFDGQPCSVISSAFSENGKTFKTGNLDGTVLEWDLESGKLLNPRDSKCRIVRLTDGKIAYSSDLKVKAQKEGEIIALYQTIGNVKIKDFPSDESARISIVFSQNNQFLTYTGYGNIKVYDLKNNEKFEVDEINSGFTLDISNDGKYLAQGGGWGDASIKVSEIKTGKSYFIDGHPSTIGGIAYSPDGETLAVGGSDKIIYLFDTIQKTLTGKINGHIKPIKRLAFSPDGKNLVSIDDDGLLKVWDWQSGSIIKDAKLDDGINEPTQVEFSKDGLYFLIAVSGGVGIFDAKSWNLLLNLKTKEGYESKSGQMTIGYSSVPVSTAIFAENGAKIISTHADGTLRIWETVSGEEIKKIKIGENAPFLLMSDEQKVLIPIGNWDAQKLKLFDIKSGKQLKTFETEDESKFEGFSMSSSGKYFITSDSGGDVFLWDVNKNKAVREFEIGYSGDDAIAFSPDGKTFAVGGRNQNLFIFDVETGEKIWQLIPDYVQSDFEKELIAKAEKLRGVIEEKLAVRKKQAEIDVEKYKNLVIAQFSHYGMAESFWNQRIAESGAPNKSKLKLPKDKASVAWFALNNDSDLPVSIDTNSMIFNPKCKGLCDGAEISSRYVIEFKNGVTNVNGFDMYSKTILPPKTIVYFSVALEHLRESKAVWVGFTFRKENPDDKDSDDYGTEQKIYLRETDLP